MAQSFDHRSWRHPPATQTSGERCLARVRAASEGQRASHRTHTVGPDRCGVVRLLTCVTPR
eukprot:1061361-Prymnesium_polylepis.1